MENEEMLTKTEFKGQSSRVLEYLLSSISPDEDFTARGILQGVQLAFPGEEFSLGGVTGFLGTLKKKGAITMTGLRNGLAGKKQEVYRIVDLSEIKTKNIHTHGGKLGRTLDGKAGKDKLVGYLMDIAQQLDNMTVKNSLSDFTTDELLKEIKKRMQSAEG
jgi:hypothetical protein